MTIGLSNAIESETIAPEPTRASVQRELREAKRLWTELKVKPAARDRRSHDWNKRRNALASALDNINRQGCVQDPLCAARLQIGLALADMLAFFSVEGKDREVHEAIAESLENAEAELKQVNASAP